MNVNNFADKRDKGFPFPSPSIASLHANRGNAWRKIGIFS
jgi:hypothetical protein